MKRVCLLLTISVMVLQESASKSTPSDWRAHINNMTGNIGAWRMEANAGNETTRAETESKLTPGNQWPWDWGVSMPQNFYDSLYNHYAPITNFQVDISDVPEIPTAESVGGTNAVVANEELFKKIEDLQKDLAAQMKKTEDLEKSLEAKVDAIDEKLNKTENKIAVCGYEKSYKVSSGSAHILTFERVYDEVNSSSRGKLDSNGYFTAGVAGTYFITLELTVALPDREKLLGSLVLSSGDYSDDGLFIYSNNWLTGGSIQEQASASRYVNLAAGETLHIELTAGGHGVSVAYTTMCVSLYSTSD